MHKHLLIDINNQASCIYKYNGRLDVALGIISKIIRNYNRNLCGRSLPTDVLNLRLFEQEDIDGTRFKTKPSLMSKSHHYFKSCFPDVNVEKESKRNDLYGEIAIYDADYKKQIEGYRYDDTITCIKIDFSEKRVVLNDGQLLKEKEVFDNVKGVDLETGDTVYYEKTDLDFFNLNFNELDEALDFLNKNKEGWINSYDNLCVPYLGETMSLS